MHLTAYRKALSLLLLSTLLSTSAAAVEIRLKPRVVSQGSLVLLGDIAHVEASEAEAARLKRIELFPAPGAGRQRMLRRRELSELLRFNGVDPALLRLRGSRVTRILPPAEPKSKAPESNPETEEDASVERIVVVIRDLRRGQTIGHDDIVLQPVTEPQQVKRAVRAGRRARDISEVVGLETIRPIRAGQPLDPQKLRRPILVRRGEVIQVTAWASGVSVRTHSRAMNDGAMGDLIEVQSLANREKYAARVTGLQEAEVYASGRRASD